MALHEEVSVSGVTEFCKFNDHEQCHSTKCACTCHHPQTEPETDVAVHVTGPAPDHNTVMVCPNCGAKRPAGEVFCRKDGGRLASLLCPMCQAVFAEGDKFCWKCGCDIAKVKETVDAGERGISRGVEEAPSTGTRGESPRAGGQSPNEGGTPRWFRSAGPDGEPVGAKPESPSSALPRGVVRPATD